MKIPAWVNNILLALYAAATPTLTLLVDHHVLGASDAADIGVIIATFATGFHGSQLVSSVKAAPVGSFVAPVAAPVITDDSLTHEVLATGAPA